MFNTRAHSPPYHSRSPSARSAHDYSPSQPSPRNIHQLVPSRSYPSWAESKSTAPCSPPTQPLPNPQPLPDPHPSRRYDPRNDDRDPRELGITTQWIPAQIFVAALRLTTLPGERTKRHSPSPPASFLRQEISEPAPLFPPGHADAIQPWPRSL